MDWSSWYKLIERLRGRPKRSPREVLQSYGRQVQTPLSSRQPRQTIQPTIEPPYQAIQPPVKSEEIVLDIKGDAALERYVSKLKNLSDFERFDSLPSLNWLRVRLDRVVNELRAFNTTPDFDEEFNFKLAKRVRKIAEIMLDIFRYAKTSPQLDERTRIELADSVEDYLANVGVTKKIFRVGDDYTDWADLGMENSFELIATRERAKDSTIAAIEIQPHEFCYRDETGQVERFTFGGSCKVYKFKES